MFFKMITALFLVLPANAAFAQASCGSLGDAVEGQLKAAASSYVEGITDNSAPRATMRELQISNSLSLARMNLELMAQNKCPPRKTPVDPMVYMGEALECELAIQKGEKDPPACNRSQWRGLAGSKSANAAGPGPEG